MVLLVVVVGAVVLVVGAVLDGALDGALVVGGVVSGASIAGGSELAVAAFVPSVELTPSGAGADEATWSVDV